MSQREMFKNPPSQKELSPRQRAVLRLLSDGNWHTTVEVCHPNVGGSEGTRRLRELRELGFNIEKDPGRAPDSTQCSYRLVGNDHEQGGQEPPDSGGNLAGPVRFGDAPPAEALKPYIYEGRSRCAECMRALLWFKTPYDNHMPITETYLPKNHWNHCTRPSRFRK